jgi:hypothetical protein
MELYKNGYVVARMNYNNKAYDAWPLSDMSDDKMALSLTDKAYDEWFIKYHMHQIVPDLNYAQSYRSYCEKIDIPVQLLLFELLDHTFTVNDDTEIIEVVGFDCLATVYLSYLQTADSFKNDLLQNNIVLNSSGLANSLEDILRFIKIRKSVIASGVNLEDFWEETPAKISIIKA